MNGTMLTMAAGGANRDSLARRLTNEAMRLAGRELFRVVLTNVSNDKYRKPTKIDRHG